MCLRAEISITIDGHHFTARPGTFVNLPVGTLHSFGNATDKPAKMLISVAPAGLEKMFLEVGLTLARRAQPRPRLPRRRKLRSC